MARHILTAAQILAIRTRRAAGETLADLSAAYDVSRKAIYYHVHGGKIWGVLGSTWNTPMRQARLAIGRSRYAEAAAHLRAAADLLDARAA